MTLEQGQRLTAMEIVIADLAGRGRRDDEIARELGIERESVAEHLSRVCRKLGIRSRGELAPEANRGSG